MPTKPSSMRARANWAAPLRERPFIRRTMQQQNRPPPNLYALPPYIGRQPSPQPADQQNPVPLRPYHDQLNFRGAHSQPEGDQLYGEELPSQNGPYMYTPAASFRQRPREHDPSYLRQCMNNLEQERRRILDRRRFTAKRRGIMNTELEATLCYSDSDNPERHAQAVDQLERKIEVTEGQLNEYARRWETVGDQIEALFTHLAFLNATVAGDQFTVWTPARGR